MSVRRCPTCGFCLELETAIARGFVEPSLEGRSRDLDYCRFYKKPVKVSDQGDCPGWLGWMDLDPSLLML